MNSFKNLHNAKISRSIDFFNKALKKYIKQNSIYNETSYSDTDLQRAFENFEICMFTRLNFIQRNKLKEIQSLINLYQNHNHFKYINQLDKEMLLQANNYIKVKLTKGYSLFFLVHRKEWIEIIALIFLAFNCFLILRNNIVTKKNTIASQENTTANENNSTANWDNTYATKDNTKFIEKNNVFTEWNNEVTRWNNEVTYWNNVITELNNEKTEENTRSNRINTDATISNTDCTVDNTNATEYNSASTENNTDATIENTVCTIENTLSTEENTVSTTLNSSELTVNTANTRGDTTLYSYEGFIQYIADEIQLLLKVIPFVKENMRSGTNTILRAAIEEKINGFSFKKQHAQNYDELEHSNIIITITNDVDADTLKRTVALNNIMLDTIQSDYNKANLLMNLKDTVQNPFIKYIWIIDKGKLINILKTKDDAYSIGHFNYAVEITNKK